MSGNKQKERQQRGYNFEEEMRSSWRRIPHCWYMKIADGRGGSRPGDYLILLEYHNILAEYKRTNGDAFKLGMLEPNQQRGLLDFEATGIPANNGVVFISFLNKEKGVDECYCFRLYDAVKYMRDHDTKQIKLEVLKNKGIPALYIPLRIAVTDSGLERVYDLKEVSTICK